MLDDLNHPFICNAKFSNGGGCDSVVESLPLNARGSGFDICGSRNRARERHTKREAQRARETEGEEDCWAYKYASHYSQQKELFEQISS